MPPDYIAAAEGAVAVGLADYAKGLYGQAEEACFESMEFAALGANLSKMAARASALLELRSRGLTSRRRPARRCLPRDAIVRRHASPKGTQPTVALGRNRRTR
jgi:hypothetical protein